MRTSPTLIVSGCYTFNGYNVTQIYLIFIYFVTSPHDNIDTLPFTLFYTFEFNYIQHIGSMFFQVVLLMVKCNTEYV